MHLRRTYRKKQGKRYAYWSLVESYRTAKGPRQRVAAYLGDLDEAACEAVKQTADGKVDSQQGSLFDDANSREIVEVDTSAVRVERVKDFGGPWLAMNLLKILGLPTFLQSKMVRGREEVPWPTMAMLLLVSRFCDPSSELRIAESSYPHSALGDLLGVADQKVNDDRLYRALDQLLPHKQALEGFLKQRLGELICS